MVDKDATPTVPKKLNASASSVKPSPTLKQAIALRALPATVSNVPRLQSTFKSTLDRLKHETSGANTIGDVLPGWLAVTTSALVAIHRVESMKYLYEFATSINGNAVSISTEEVVPLEEKVRRIAVMREAAFQVSVTIGFPRVINGLAVLYEAISPDALQQLQSISLPLRELSTQDELRAKGGAVFNAVYTPHTRKLLGKLGQYHPDFPDVIIQHAYGGVLSGPPGNVGQHTPIITRTFTSALSVAVLRVEGNGPQLTSHVHGLLKASKEPGAASLTPVESFLSSDVGAQWVLDTVDELSDAIADAAGESN